MVHGSYNFLLYDAISTYAQTERNPLFMAIRFALWIELGIWLFKFLTVSQVKLLYKFWLETVNIQHVEYFLLTPLY